MMNTTFSKEIFKDNKLIATLYATVDGENMPVVVTEGQSTFYGYDEDGYPILAEFDDELVESERLEFTKEVMKMHAMFQSMK